MKKVISTRLEPSMIAKARDGLISRGYEQDQLATVSNVVRLTFLHGLTDLIPNSQEIKSPASIDSLTWIQQKLNQRADRKTLTIDEILSGDKE